MLDAGHAGLALPRRPVDAVPRAYSWRAIGLGAADALAAVAGLWLARLAFTAEPDIASFLAQRWPASLALPLMAVASQYYSNTYSTEVLQDRAAALLRALKASSIAGVLFLLLRLAVGQGSMSPAETLIALGAAALGSLCARAFVRDAIGFAVRRVVILGAGPAGQELASLLAARPGYALCGFLDDAPGEHGGVGGAPVLGPTAAVTEVVSRVGADLVVVAETRPLPADAERSLQQLEFRHVGLVTMPALYEMLSGRVPIRYLGTHWYAALGYTSPDPLLLAMKRSIDLAAAVALLVTLAPFMLVVAALVRLTSPGPALYSQERVGLRGRTFRLWKFRSMRSDAERSTGPVWAGRNDPRVTPLGRIMRKTRVDELPQLWNVLHGDMSLTGPRPERPVFVERFAQSIPFYAKRLAVRPGLTGWAQVMHRYDESEEDVAEKLQYDLYYIRHWSLLLDVQIWIKTIATILTGSGAR